MRKSWIKVFTGWTLNQDGMLDQHGNGSVTRRCLVRPKTRCWRSNQRSSGRTSAQKRWFGNTRVARLDNVATPVIDRGNLYMVKEGGIVTKLEVATGQLLQEERVPGGGNYFASPVAGDGKVYFASELGIVSVLASQGGMAGDFIARVPRTNLRHMP